MKRKLALASALMFAFCLTGCGDTHESLAKDSLNTMKKMVSTLEGVKDEKSAKAAKPKLKSLSDELTKINEKQSKLKPPTEAELKAMDTKYGKEMEATGQKLMSETFRVMSVPGAFAELNGINLGGR